MTSSPHHLPLPERLPALRAALAARDLQGFVVPLTDEHGSEYVGDYARRLHWLTGFDGSAGTAAVLGEHAAVFVDGRYTLQVRTQVDTAVWTPVGVAESSVAAWLAAHARAGDRIGYDPWLHAPAWVTATGAALESSGATLVAVADNPVDAVWIDRPALSTAPLEPYSDDLAGRTSAAKRAALAEGLAADGLDAAVVTALDSVAWLLNLRGADVLHTPVGLAFALAHRDGTVDLFAEPEKLTPAVRQQLGNAVRTYPYDALLPQLRAFSGRVGVDPGAAAAVWDALGDRAVKRRDPVLLPKATKNAAELAGHRAAQARDTGAMAGVLAWLADAAPAGQLTELAVVAEVSRRRAAAGATDASFDTIAGAGANGAVIHYRATAATDRRLEPNSVFLLDSGGQYREGTTDVTRTVWVGPDAPPALLRDRFTRVLRGHIALATATFPLGTRGGQLDALARAPLWEAGLDYAHGTGHGVGAALAVHEGPQRIAKPAGGQAGTDEPLLPGMILSNEPGYYRPGEWGIRIENLIAVEERDVPGGDAPMLGFETLTWVPIDRRLIDPEALSAAERRWVDDYHARTLAELRAVDPPAEVLAWATPACAPLRPGEA